GVVPNVYAVHLERAGSLENIARGKAELIEALPPAPEGVAVLNADDPHSRPLIARWKGNVMTFGQSGRASVRLMEARLSRRGGYDAVVARGAKRWGLHVPLAGRHNALNAVAAFAACMAAGAPPEKAARGVARVTAANMRLNVMTLPNGARLINDAYNANPASTRAALMASAELAVGGRLYFAFGDMLELGKESDALHRAVAHDAARAGVARIVAFGKRAALTAREARAMGIPGETRATRRAVAAWLAKRLRPGDVALVKGSRGMAMEMAVEELVSMMRG
ncbi:MAG: UDP-N-acetylmuramoyl-tripeptide--D-alanyl-D-alanine ligase, partial [Nitrospinae bacterium]|nr:UDP-N-acetylmuramoyl-tripeptide--D-alanyl-D-alanine ligase [Nitrospinota bacterium]